MISFSNINKQYGKQLVFVDASFQLNPGEKVGLVGPNGAGKTTLFRMVVREESPDEGEVSVPKKLTIGYFRQDVEEMKGRPVLDEAIAGSGRAGARRSHRRQWARRRSAPRTGRPASRHERSRARRRYGPDTGALRRGAGGVRASGRLWARGASPRGAARPGVRGRPDRRRCRGVVGRLEDARGAGARPARPAGRAADGRTHQPPGHRVDHLAGTVPQVVPGRYSDDLARPRVHEPRRLKDCGDRCGRDRLLLGRLRFLRA